MKKFLYLLLLIVAFSCNDDIDDIIDNEKEETESNKETEQTVFLYMPWSNNLTSYFLNNLKDFEYALSEDIMNHDRFIVFFAGTSQSAVMFEFKYKDGIVSRDTIKAYEESTFITPSGITNLINEVKNIAPAKTYSMIISSHGMSWLPKDMTKARSIIDKEYWDYDAPYLTRYFGGTTSQYQIEINDFAKGVSDSNTKFEYILFDDCYMSSIEVAYELKDITRYLIASPTEIMAYGYPYKIISEHLFDKADYKSICDGFYNFYSSYTMPYGTIAVTVCSEVEKMAQIMKEINSLYDFDENKIGNIQRLDGYTPIIFYDFGSYVENLCKDSYLLEQFNQQLDKMIPPEYRLSTKSYYCMGKGIVYLNTYSGLNTSEPSYNTKTVAYSESSWYKATH